MDIFTNYGGEDDESSIGSTLNNKRIEKLEFNINQLSERGVEIWYGQFKKAEKISEVLNLYSTNKEKEKIKLFYLYIDKSDSFSLENFINFIKQTLNEYEEKYIRQC